MVFKSLTNSVKIKKNHLKNIWKSGKAYLRHRECVPKSTTNEMERCLVGTKKYRIMIRQKIL